MNDHAGLSIGIVGTGLVGLGWTVVFGRAGCSMRLFDVEPSARAAAMARLRASLAEIACFGLVEAVAARVTVVDTLAVAVEAPDCIQESCFEQVDAKRQVSHAIGAGETASDIPHRPTRSWPRP